MANKKTPLSEPPPGSLGRASPPDTDRTVPPISMMNETNTDTVYYYSREHRLSRASAVVQDLNNGKTIRPNFFKTLFSTRGNKMLIFSVILCFSAFGIANRLSGKSNEIKLDGNTLTVAIIREEGVLSLAMAKNTRKNTKAYVGAVDIAVSPVMTKSKETSLQEFPPIYSYRIFFDNEDTQTYRELLPFDGASFFIVMRTDEEQKSIKINAIESKK